MAKPTMSAVVLMERMAAEINGDRGGFPEAWPHRFRAVEMARGHRIVVEVAEDQSIAEVPLEDVVNKLVAWSRLQHVEGEVLLLTVKRAQEIAAMWLAMSTPIMPADIAPVRWKSEPGYTWRRMPWDAGDGPTPTWDKILGKMTNAAAFRAWLGSLMFTEAKQHQYVWVHGMGNDGKGSMNRFLKAVFGRSYRSKQPPAMGDKFWTYGLIGSRLVVFPDCNSQKFTTGGMFKSLSGGDPVDVEAKGKMSFTVELACKFLFFSNEKPNISCEKADMRRIIYCEFTEQTKESDADPHFEEKLWAEGGDFLGRCVREYLAACPRHQPIENEKEDIQTWVETHEEEYSVIFDEFFTVTACEEYRNWRNLGGLTLDQLYSVTVSPADMLAVLQAKFYDRKDQGAFRDWLYKKYGVKKKAIRCAGKVVYCYPGIHRLLTAKAAEHLSRLRAAEKLGMKTVSTPSTVSTKPF